MSDAVKIGLVGPPLMEELLTHYVAPSEALWRFAELEAVRGVTVARPVLEIGCGDGTFTRLSVGHIDQAIDVSPRAVERARRDTDVYERVDVADARDLQPADGAFATVFANCVLEHIPGVESVLSACARALEEGGQLITTVPLEAMNHHLAVSTGRYARWRQHSLVHHNLWTEDRWVRELVAAGFSNVEIHPYITGDLCRLWDTLDAPITVGRGRYRVSSVLHVGRHAVPQSLRDRVKRWLAPRLVGAIRRRNASGEACAALIVATK